jgi:lysyl endopeptidase
MKQLIASYCILISCFFLENGNAQTSENAIPYSASYKLQPINEFVDMPSFDAKTLLEEDKINGFKSNRFAKMFDVDLHPDNAGFWQMTECGRVWRLGIRSKGAYSLYFIFNAYKLKKGVKLFIYNEQVTHFAGAFTSSNNNLNNVLSVNPIPGEAMIIELDVPAGLSDFGILELRQVAHDYTNEFGSHKTLKSADDLSESCMVDINCPEGVSWQNEKRAVCKIICNTDVCTGALVNNAGNEVIPYVLTAQHCNINTPASAAVAQFLFNYERPICGFLSENVIKTLSGSTLIATTDSLLDFTLLKLNQFPSVMYRPYFAGWDINPFSPSSGFCIHHPNQDVMKISIENHRLITGDYKQIWPSSPYDLNSHWVVRHWEKGSTQGGSSGAPIFNSAHRIFGILSGGAAKCTDPVNDYFTKLSRAWADYPGTANQLENWLDPDYTGVTFLDGFDPYGFTDAHCDTFSNLTKTDTLEINKSNLSWGYISGHNSAGYTKFAEKFVTYDSLHLPGIFLNVAKAYNSSIFSTVTIKIWDGAGSPTSEKYSKVVYLKDLQKNSNNFVEFDSLLLLYGSFFIGYSVSYGLPADTFAVFHDENRGVSGISSMFIYDGSWHNISEVTSPSIHTSLAISFPGCIGLNLSVKVPEITRQSLKIFPNPCYDQTFIEFPYRIDKLKVECIDMLGIRINLKYNQEEKGINVDLSNVKPGIYTLVLTTKDNRWTGRFVVSNY